jgi:hypothetical protein
MSAVGAQLGITLPLRMLFEAPTPAHIAQKIQSLLALTTTPAVGELADTDEVIEF